MQQLAIVAILFAQKVFYFQYYFSFSIQLQYNESKSMQYYYFKLNFHVMQSYMMYATKCENI
jgi:hypothetical protein